MVSLELVFWETSRSNGVMDVGGGCKLTLEEKVVPRGRRRNLDELAFSRKTEPTGYIERMRVILRSWLMQLWRLEI